MFDEVIYDSNDEYIEDGYDSDEEEKWGWALRRKLWLKLNAIKYVSEKLLLIHQKLLIHLWTITEIYIFK